MRPPGIPRIAIGLFFALWLLNGVLINSSNLLEFNLQQMGIEAIVERGHFYVEGSKLPQLTPVNNVDVFEYECHLYAAKQPGQFLSGALVYWLLYHLGLSYTQNFLVASALVTFFTTSMVTALAAAAVFLFARDLIAPSTLMLLPLLVAIGFGIATTALPYSGISHHDAIASSLLFIAFYCLFRSARNQVASRGNWLALAAGVLLGWVITTSMLPSLMVLVALTYLVSFGRWKAMAWLVFGLAMGLVPLLLYDAISFGNPLTLPNVAGDYSDTFFHLDPDNFQSKLVFYGTFLVEYTPLVLWGLLGLLLLPSRFRREQIFILGMVGVLGAYVFNVDTVGHCQYGPRYLLPAMPFLALGLIGFAFVGNRWLRWPVVGLVGATGLFSAASNIVGAMFGAMYCDIQWYAFPYYLRLLSRGKFLTFPLAAWLILPLAASIIVLALELKQRQAPPVLAESTAA